MKTDRPWASLGVMIAGMLIFDLLYMPINYFNSGREFHYQLFTQWELNIPLWDWMILFYVSAYILPLFPYFKLSFKEHVLLAKTVALSGVIGGIVFLIWPTALGWERNLAEISPFFQPLFKLLWKLDYPHNLVPSLHVDMCFLLVFPAIRNYKHWQNKVGAICWFTGICASILLVHQHHILDLFTGLILAYLSYQFYYLPRAKALEVAEKNTHYNDSDQDRLAS